MRQTFENSSSSNRKQLAATVNGAKNEIRSMSIMYYVNQLNKLARKNEFVEGVNIKDLGVLVKSFSGEKDLFTARVFSKDVNGRPCYIAAYKGSVQVADLIHGEIITEKECELRVSADEQRVVVYKPVQMSLTGLIAAYKAVLQPVAAAADKAAREQQKAARKTANKAAAAARKLVREQQKQAIADYQNGKIDIKTFADIMAIAC